MKRRLQASISLLTLVALSCTGNDGDRIPECDDDNPCTIDSVDPWSMECRHDIRDDDGDGARAAFFEGRECFGTDCDDTDPLVHPGATEVCSDGVDQDCDGIVDGLVHAEGSERIISTGRIGDVIWTGSEYAMAFVEDRSGTPYKELLYARFGPEDDSVGAVTTLYEPTLFGPDIYETGPEVSDMAWSGRRIGVAWTSGWMNFTSVDLDGSNVRELRYFMTGGWAASPSVVWTGSVFAMSYVGYQCEYDPAGDICDGWLHFALLDEESTTMPEFRVLAHEQLGYICSELVWTGSEFGVIWQVGGDHTTPYRTMFRRVTAGGVPSVTSIEVFSGQSHNACNLVWTGSAYTTAWYFHDHSSDDPDGIYMMGIDGAGHVLHTPRLVVPDTTLRDLSLLWTGDAHILTWFYDDSHSSSTQLSFVRIDADLTPVEAPDVVMFQMLRQDEVNTTWTGEHLGVTWNHFDDMEDVVYIHHEKVLACD